jgi:hypothetical protein
LRRTSGDPRGTVAGIPYNCALWTTLHTYSSPERTFCQIAVTVKSFFKGLGNATLVNVAP